jgi:hypothetical protein
VNKTASNAVYVVVAVMLIFAASAQAAPVQSASTLLACTAQLSLTFEGKGGNLYGFSQSGTLLVMRTIGSRAYPCRSSLVFEDASNTRLPIFRKTLPGMHHLVIISTPPPILGTQASSEMYSQSGDVSDISKYFSTASFRIALGTDILRASFSGHHGVASGQDAKYRLAYLKRDPVYVRSKI